MAAGGDMPVVQLLLRGRQLQRFHARFCGSSSPFPSGSRLRCLPSCLSLSEEMTTRVEEVLVLQCC